MSCPDSGCRIVDSALFEVYRRRDWRLSCPGAPVLGILRDLLFRRAADRRRAGDAAAAAGAGRPDPAGDL